MQLRVSFEQKHFRTETELQSTCNSFLNFHVQANHGMQRGPSALSEYMPEAKLYD